MSGQADSPGLAAQAGSSLMAADFTERDINDVMTVSLSGYRGMVVVLNFWGPWCPPCRVEVPDLEALQNAHKNKLVVIGAAVFSPEISVLQFYKDYRMNYPVIWGSYDLMEKYGKVAAFPTTFIIDRKGRIVHTLVGPRNIYQFEQLVKPLLDQ